MAFDGTATNAAPTQPLHIQRCPQPGRRRRLPGSPAAFLSWYLAAYAEQEVQAARNNARGPATRGDGRIGHAGGQRGHATDAKQPAHSLHAGPHGRGPRQRRNRQHRTPPLQSIKVVKAVLRALVKAGGFDRIAFDLRRHCWYVYLVEAKHRWSNTMKTAAAIDHPTLSQKGNRRNLPRHPFPHAGRSGKGATRPRKPTWRATTASCRENRRAHQRD